MQFNKAEEEVVTFSRKNEEEWEEWIVSYIHLNFQLTDETPCS